MCEWCWPAATCWHTQDVKQFANTNARMLTLLSECHLWTMRDEVRIKPTDLGAFRYARSRELQQDPMALAKRDYTERRNGVVVPKNSRKTAGRLKDNIKRLEELLRAHKVVHAEWRRDAAQVLVLFANGIIAHICVHVATGDIQRMVFEKYFVGKLATETVTDAFFTRSHIVLAYNSNQLTVVHLQKPNARPQGPEKISNMDPRIFHVIIPGPGARKLSRNLAVNSSADLFVIWTKSSQNEVYPWRPTIRDQDRANIHVFKLKGMQLESISYCWSENDPLCVDFLRSAESQILTVEQKVSRKGEVSAEICTYEINSGKMLRTAITSIPMGTQICCYAFSPDQEKLFLGSIDRKICLHDLVSQTNKFVSQIEIIPTKCSWHCDSSLVMIANDRSQFQCYDLALTPISNQLQSEDVTPLNLLDLSHYFAVQPTLLQLSFSRKPELGNFALPYAQTDCFLLLLFESGPIGCLRFFAGAGMRGDIHNSGLTADVVVDKYLALNQLEKAVQLLTALNWETYGAMCLISLHKIANHVFFRGDARRARIELMAKALKTFGDSLSEETKDEFSDQVFDLKRRFFFFLMRKNLFVEAFEVAQDIDDYDLFMDLFNVTKSDGNLIEFSSAAFSQAAAILHQDDRANGNLSLAGDYRSESACSQSTYSDAPAMHQSKRGGNQQQNHDHLKNYVPPLPSFKSKVFSAEMIKINIPKPELRMDCAHETQQRNRPPPPPLPTLKHLKVTQTATATTTTTTAATTSLASNLAELSMKSGSDQQRSKSVNGSNAASPKLLPWLQVADPVLMASTTTSLYTSSPATTLLPRASTTNTLNASSYAKGVPHQQTAPFVHHAAPAIVSEPASNALATTPQRNGPLPQPISNPSSSAMYKPKFYQHPLVSGKIPSTALGVLSEEHQKRLLQKKPTASILSNSSTTQQNGHLAGGSPSLQLNGGNSSGTSKEIGNGRNTAGEKNKVKFSDTVQVAVVPEIPRKEKPMPPKRNGYSRPPPRNLTNPKKELADSLPLCHPNDDYLKDFNPISAVDAPRLTSKTTTTREEHKSRKSGAPQPSQSSSIKVVHFGVV